MVARSSSRPRIGCLGSLAFARTTVGSTAASPNEVETTGTTGTTPSSYEKRRAQTRSRQACSPRGTPRYLTAKLYLQVGPSVTGSRGRADGETLVVRTPHADPPRLSHSIAARA